MVSQELFPYDCAPLTWDGSAISAISVSRHPSGDSQSVPQGAVSPSLLDCLHLREVYPTRPNSDDHYTRVSSNDLVPGYVGEEKTTSSTL
jgi:hypothetical protein